MNRGQLGEAERVVSQKRHNKIRKMLDPRIAVLSTATGGAMAGVTIGAAFGRPISTLAGGIVGAVVGVATGVLSRPGSTYEKDDKPAAQR